MIWSVLTLTAIVLVVIPSYRVLCRWTYAAFAVVIVLLLLVYVFPPINGAQRWIRFGRIGLQPSEITKVAYVLALARYLMYRENYRQLRGLLVPLALTILPVLLILKEPDLGTSLVFLPVLLIMLFAAGARTVDLAKVIAVGLLALPLLWSQMSREQRSRVTALAEQTGPQERPTDDGYHLHQSKQMFALGNVWGSLVQGDAVEDRAVYHLPDAHTDFIFSMIGERLGLPGIAAVLGLFCLLAWRGLAVAAATREPFGRLAAVGLVALISVQVLINTAMTVGLAPITGMSLPFVSYGGSGLLAHGIALGLLLNIGVRPGYEVTKEPFRYLPEKKRVGRFTTPGRRDSARLPTGALRT